MKMFATFIISIAIGIFIIEAKSSMQLGIYSQTVGSCDFDMKYVFRDKYTSTAYFLGQYWKIRGTEIQKVNDKNLLVETLFAVSLKHGKLCSGPVKRELSNLAGSGYDFKKYRHKNGHTHILAEVLVQNLEMVKWLIENNGFVNSSVTRKDSPYHGQNIFELANSLNSRLQTQNSSMIFNLISTQEEFNKKISRRLTAPADFGVN